MTNSSAARRYIEPIGWGKSRMGNPVPICTCSAPMTRSGSGRTSPWLCKTCGAYASHEYQPATDGIKQAGLPLDFDNPIEPDLKQDKEPETQVNLTNPWKVSDPWKDPTPQQPGSQTQATDQIDITPTINPDIAPTLAEFEQSVKAGKIPAPDVEFMGIPLYRASTLSRFKTGGQSPKDYVDNFSIPMAVKFTATGIPSELSALTQYSGVEFYRVEGATDHKLAIGIKAGGRSRDEGTLRHALAQQGFIMKPAEKHLVTAWLALDYLGDARDNKVLASHVKGMKDRGLERQLNSEVQRIEDPKIHGSGIEVALSPPITEGLARLEQSVGTVINEFKDWKGQYKKNEDWHRQNYNRKRFLEFVNPPEHVFVNTLSFYNLPVLRTQTDELSGQWFEYTKGDKSFHKYIIYFIFANIHKKRKGLPDTLFSIGESSAGFSRFSGHERIQTLEKNGMEYWVFYCPLFRTTYQNEVDRKQLETRLTENLNPFWETVLDGKGKNSWRNGKPFEPESNQTAIDWSGN